MDGFFQHVQATVRFPLSSAIDIFSSEIFLGILGIKPWAAESGSIYAHHYVMLPAPLPTLTPTPTPQVFQSFLCVSILITTSIVKNKLHTVILKVQVGIWPILHFQDLKSDLGRKVEGSNLGARKYFSSKIRVNIFPPLSIMIYHLFHEIFKFFVK